MVKLVVAAAFAAVLVYTLWDIFKGYWQGGNTPAERLKSAFRKSATVLVARVAQLAFGGLGFAASAAELLGASGAATSLQGVIPPDYAPYFTAGVAFLSEMARRRTLEK